MSKQYLRSKKWRDHCAKVEGRFERVRHALNLPTLPPPDDRSADAIKRLAEAFQGSINDRYIAQESVARWHDEMKRRKCRYLNARFTVAGWKRQIRFEHCEEAAKLLIAHGIRLSVDVQPIVDYITHPANAPPDEICDAARNAAHRIEVVGVAAAYAQKQGGGEWSAATSDLASVVRAARNFDHCITWCLSHWLTAIDYEDDRQRAAEASNRYLVEHNAEKCDQYESDRDENWREARASGFTLLGAARQWGLPASAIEGLLTSLHHSYLPSICGVQPSDYNRPPDFEPALAEARVIGQEAEVRAHWSVEITPARPADNAIKPEPDPSRNRPPLDAGQNGHARLPDLRVVEAERIFNLPRGTVTRWCKTGKITYTGAQADDDRVRQPPAG